MPLVFHGTRRQFSEFMPGKPRGAYGNPVGIYFTSDLREAEEFAQDVDGATDEKSRIVAAEISIRDESDGLIRHRQDGTTEYVVFKPGAIKIVIDNLYKVSSPLNPNFKSWFKNSKVVDSQGMPLMMFHGTTTEFPAFSKGTDKAHPMLAANDNGLGFFFTPDPGQRSDCGPWTGAARYAGLTQIDGETVAKTGANIVPVYLSIQCPYKVELGEYFGSAGDWTQEGLEVLGFDGIEVTRQGKPHFYIAFRPEQIKSAIGNSGRYDINSDSLTDYVEDEDQEIEAPCERMRA